MNRIIVSPGGHPDDGDLYIAQRALELIKTAIMDKGEILFLSACKNGIGPVRSMEHFYEKLKLPLEQILHTDPEYYKLYSHKPYRFAQLIKRLEKIWIHSTLDDETAKAIHLYPTQEPQKIIDNWIYENPYEKILIVDGANKLALQAQNGK